MVVAAGQVAWSTLCARAHPLSLPQSGGWLILAPHPDDEALGAGGLLAALADKGLPVWVAYLTSGEASHCGAPRWSRRRIARMREAESRRALHRLGQATCRPLTLGWNDGRPPPVGGAVFRRACARLLDLCRRHDIRNIATTWRGEAHCDHRAAYELANALTRRNGGINLYEYIVWGWTDPSLPEKAATFAIEALETTTLAERCRAAIACHRTQVSSLIRGARQSFRLSPEMIALASRSPLILLHESHSHAA